MSDPILPEGLWEKDGKLFFECRGCEKATEWPADPEDYEHGHWSNMCGGSPWCCP